MVLVLLTIIQHRNNLNLFEEQETTKNRELTGNWTWLIPPVSPATTHVFHQPMANIIKKPNYFYQKDPYE